MSHSNERTPEVGRVKRLLWWASGATPSVLIACPTEHYKYSAIGASMLFIALVAATGAGFALQQSYGSLLIAVIGGLAWGALIFTVDRLIQISIRKEENNNRKSFWMALPRLLMIVVLSFLITDPLLHKFFENDINYELARETQRAASESKTVADARYSEELTRLETSYLRFDGGVNKLKSERDQKFNEWMAEGAGTGGTRIHGKGVFYREKEAAYRQADQEYQEERSRVEPEIEQIKARIRELKNQQDEDIRQVIDVKAKAKGLLARNSALFSIIRHDFGAAAFAIMLLLAFILLESTPLTLKLMSKRGPYEERFDAEEQEQIFAEKQRLEERKKIIQLEAESRGERSASLLELMKESMSKIKTAVLKNEHQNLRAEEAELAKVLRAYVKENLLKDLMQKQPQTISPDLINNGVGDWESDIVTDNGKKMHEVLFEIGLPNSKKIVILRAHYRVGRPDDLTAADLCWYFSDFEKAICAETNLPVTLSPLPADWREALRAQRPINLSAVPADDREGD